MNKKLLTSSLLISTSLILLNGPISVNDSSFTSFRNHPALQADGIPLPPPKGPSKPIADGIAVTADGIPLPPPKGPSKPISDGIIMTADGIPLPPPKGPSKPIVNS
jgi:hypothetical protein